MHVFHITNIEKKKYTHQNIPASYAVWLNSAALTEVLVKSIQKKAKTKHLHRNRGSLHKQYFKKFIIVSPKNN